MLIYDIEQIRRFLEDRRVGRVAGETGVNRNTIAKIRDGHINDPSYKTIQALSEYIDKKGNL